MERRLKLIKQFISVSTQVEFIHQYAGAPEEVSFLSYPHRHLLHITAEIEVFNDDRELEFIIVKRGLTKYLDTLNLTEVSNTSCETLGRGILLYLTSHYGANRDMTITVSEDGENGSILKYTKEEA